MNIRYVRIMYIECIENVKNRKEIVDARRKIKKGERMRTPLLKTLGVECTNWEKPNAFVSFSQPILSLYLYP